MARKVALINMKGGVGKSTLAANLAWAMATSPWHKKVLVIDLDPQFNCSQYMVRPNRLEQIFASEAPTVQDIFEFPRRTDHSKAIVKVYSPDFVYLPLSRMSRGGAIDLIPSNLQLSKVLRKPACKERLLKCAVEHIEDRYDLVIVDCPPTESLFTTAAYLAADYILVPVRPQFFASVGLPLLEKSLNEFEILHPGEAPKVLGIVFNAVRDLGSRSTQEGLQMDNVRRAASQSKWEIFETEVVYSESFPRGTSEGNPIFWTDHARSNVKGNFHEFAQEFARKVGYDSRQR